MHDAKSVHPNELWRSVVYDFGEYEKLKETAGVPNNTENQISG